MQVGNCLGLGQITGGSCVWLDGSKQGPRSTTHLDASVRAARPWLGVGDRVETERVWQACASPDRSSEGFSQDRKPSSFALLFGQTAVDGTVRHLRPYRVHPVSSRTSAQARAARTPLRILSARHREDRPIARDAMLVRDTNAASPANGHRNLETATSRQRERIKRKTLGARRLHHRKHRAK